MTEEVAAAEHTQEEAVTGQEVVETQEEQTQAPEKEKAGLQEALIAERRKRQEAEALNKYLQQQTESFQAQYQSKQAAPEEEEDEYTREIKQYTESKIQKELKSVLERQYLAGNPQLLEQNPVSGRTWLEDQLEPILKKKPYLAHAIQSAENRYERAMEIINDYTPKASENDNRKRLEENATKPGSPAGLAKSGNLNKLEQIKNMNRKEFSEYRAGLRGRAPNIR